MTTNTFDIDIDPSDTSKQKDATKLKEIGLENSNESFYDGSDLDVPGAELDDANENIGNEDEENNYYSLGGDDHND